MKAVCFLYLIFFDHQPFVDAFMEEGRDEAEGTETLPLIEGLGARIEIRGADEEAVVADFSSDGEVEVDELFTDAHIPIPIFYAEESEVGKSTVHPVHIE